MVLERCRSCTAPIYVRLAANWNDDGTITGRFASGTRVVQIYASEINRIVSGITERIDLDISRIIVEGERKAAIDFTGDVLDRAGGLVGSLSRNRLVSRFVFGFVLRAAKNAGLGSGRLAEYQRGNEAVVDFVDPFNIAILAGDMLGAFEAFFRKRFEVTWEGDLRFARIVVTSESGDSHVEEERLVPVLPPTQPGNVDHERCPRCGIPLDVTRRYHFDLKKGIATEISTGRRVVTVIIDSINAVFRELESELGPEIPGMIVDIESDYISETTRRPEGEGEREAIETLLGDLSIKGMGNPADVSVENERLRVRIDNPFCDVLLAGRLLGFYRVVWGEPADVAWIPDRDGYTVIEAFRPE